MFFLGARAIFQYFPIAFSVTLRVFITSCPYLLLKTVVVKLSGILLKILGRIATIKAESLTGKYASEEARVLAYFTQ